MFCVLSELGKGLSLGFTNDPDIWQRLDASLSRQALSFLLHMSSLALTSCRRSRGTYPFDASLPDILGLGPGAGSPAALSPFQISYGIVGVLGLNDPRS
jgi:hypothetical protein